MSSFITNKTWVPAGVVGALLIGVVGLVRFFDGHEVGLATLRVQVQALEQRVNVESARLDRADARWDQIRDDLSKIKERLGIVESRPKL